MKKKKQYGSSAHHFLKAEAFCAEVISNGVVFDKIRLKSDSNFKKSFRDDIEKVVFTQNAETHEYDIDLTVNRDGIYDRLPEGLFHQTRGNSKTQTVTQMTEEYRRFREEEKLARRFFQPLEQEFFRYSTLVEMEERNLAFDLLNGNLKNELLVFWGVPKDLPENIVRKLVQLMPWVGFIKGSPELSCGALSLLLSKEVQFSRSEFSRQKASGSATSLGIGQLGIDTTAGEEFWEPGEYWTFTIDGVRKDEIEFYRPEGPFGKLLQHFEEIFIPLPIDIRFEFEVVPAAADVETDDVLGYSLVI